LHFITEYLRDRKRKKREADKLKKDTEFVRDRIRKDRIRNLKFQIVNLFKRTPKEDEIGQKSELVYRYKFWFGKLKAGYSIIKEHKSLRNELTISYLNSLVGFLLAFIIFYMVSNFTAIITAKIFNIPAVFYSYRVFWPLYTYSSLYTRQAIILIFGVGPLLSIVLAVVLFQIVKKTLRFKRNFRLVLLWMIFHALNMFFGAYIVGVITRTGFIYTSEWLFLSNIFDVEEIIFMISAIMILLILGFYFPKYILLSASNNVIIDPRIRFFYMVFKVLLPWLSGFGLLYLLNFPNNPPELILLIGVSFLMIFPTMVTFNSIKNREIKIWNEKNKESLGWIYIIIAILLLGLYRFILYNGVSFS